MKNLFAGNVIVTLYQQVKENKQVNIRGDFLLALRFFFVLYV